MKRSTLSFIFFLTLLLEACSPSNIGPTAVDSQLINEVKAIDQGLLFNKTDYLLYQASGVRVAIHSFGKGSKPLASQKVQFHSLTKLFYTSALVDSNNYNLFSSSISPSGLKEGILNLPEGSKATIYVPSSLGYGPNGNGSTIPGNAVLAYEVELKKVTRSASEQVQFNADTAAIHKYLVDSSITSATYDSSGIWYTIDNIGNGITPDPFYKVGVDYKGTFLTNGAVFDQGTLNNQYLLSLIDGFRIGVTLMKVGSTATFYIPSGLAYGIAGSGTISPNANLVFQIKLNSAAK